MIPIGEVFLHVEKFGLTGMGRMDRMGKERFPCAAGISGPIFSIAACG